jgi:hypothetical protein
MSESQQHNYTEEEEEENVLDEETKSKLKNITFDESMFSAQTGKTQNKKEKKVKKNKRGQDFMDYAKTNGIDVKIQYEDINTKQNFNEQDNKKPLSDSNPHYKKNFPQNNYKYQSQQRNNNVNAQSQQVKVNKFDSMQAQSYNPMMYSNYNSFNAQTNTNFYYNQQNPEEAQAYYQMMLFQQQQMAEAYRRQMIQQEEAGSLVSALEYYLSQENLNKDYYIRSKLNDEGFLDAEELIKFNSMKAKGIKIEDVEFAVKNSQNLKYVKTSDGKLFLKNINWDDFCSGLLSMEEIKFQKQNRRLQNSGFDPNGNSMQANEQFYHMTGVGQYNNPYNQPIQMQMQYSQMNPQNFTPQQMNMYGYNQNNYTNFNQ